MADSRAQDNRTTYPQRYQGGSMEGLGHDWIPGSTRRIDLKYSEDAATNAVRLTSEWTPAEEETLP